MQRESSRNSLAEIINASPDEPHVKTLVEQAAILSCTEWCSACNAHGGPGGRLCKPYGIHYGRVLAAHIARKITDAQLVAVQIALGSSAPVADKLLRLEQLTESAP